MLTRRAIFSGQWNCLGIACDNIRRAEVPMRRPPPAFNNKESRVLIAIYEDPDVPYSSYLLTQKLNPKIQIGTPEYLVAFTDTCDAIEDLIVRSLLRGKRLKGANGIYFADLKLTTKGEQT